MVIQFEFDTSKWKVLNRKLSCPRFKKIIKILKSSSTSADKPAAILLCRKLSCINVFQFGPLIIYYGERKY